jgi:hypothetical protein
LPIINISIFIGLSGIVGFVRGCLETICPAAFSVNRALAIYFPELSVLGLGVK